MRLKMIEHKSWDLYFLRIAREVSKRSKCMSRQVGAALVKDKAIISTGYNGPARGMKHCNERNIQFYCDLDYQYKNSMISTTGNYEPTICPRKKCGYQSGQGLHLCQAGHAERNALIQSARNGISTKGTTLYCYCCRPCKDCMIEIINAGISTLVYLIVDKDYDPYSATLLDESNIVTRVYKEIELLEEIK